jgi:hypothetical protein
MGTGIVTGKGNGNQNVTGTEREQLVTIFCIIFPHDVFQIRLQLHTSTGPYFNVL